MRCAFFAVLVVPAFVPGSLLAQATLPHRITSTRVVAVFYKEPTAEQQSQLCTQAKKAAQFWGLRSISCEITSLTLDSDRLPLSLKAAIERDAHTLASWGKLDTKTLVLQFYDQVAEHGELAVHNLGKPIFVMESQQFLAIRDVAIGQQPQARPRSAPMTASRFLFTTIGVVCSIMLFVCVLMPDDKGRTRWIRSLVPFVVMVIAGIANRQAAADFVVTTGVLPFFLVGGMLLLGAFFRACGLLIGFFRWRR